MENMEISPLTQEQKIREEIDSLEMQLTGIEQQKFELENRIEAKKAELESLNKKVEEDKLPV